MLVSPYVSECVRVCESVRVCVLNVYIHTFYIDIL